MQKQRLLRYSGYTTWILSIGVGLAPFCAGQVLMKVAVPGVVPLMASDVMLRLETDSATRSLPCAVRIEKPILGWDLKFYALYSVEIPIEALLESGTRLSVVFRVAPTKATRDPVYFEDFVRAPPAAPSAKGSVTLSGVFALGEGDYSVKWSMHDQTGRFCTTSWSVSAALPPRDKDLPLSIAAGDVRAVPRDLFEAEELVPKGSSAALHVKVLVHFAPERESAASVSPAVMVALVSILRNISRDPRVAKISVVGFNLQQRRVLFQQDEVDQINFPSLGESVQHLETGMIDVTHLLNIQGDSNFLVDLVKQTETVSSPDALIFVGPKTTTEGTLSPAQFAEVGNLHSPVFYLNYANDLEAEAQRDNIGRMVKMLRGREIVIRTPRDVGIALRELLSRVTVRASAH